jgi:uncharacterized protein
VDDESIEKKLVATGSSSGPPPSSGGFSSAGSPGAFGAAIAGAAAGVVSKLTGGLKREADPGGGNTAPAEATRPSKGQLADVDGGLGPLPEGYGASRIMLLPKDPQSAYAYWDVPQEAKQAIRNQGGLRLALRLADVTGLAAGKQAHNIQQFDCDELARDWHLAIPVSDRDYLVELGYVAQDGRWLVLTTSNPVRIPPAYPSDWDADQFLTLNWEVDLKGQTFVDLERSPQDPGAIGVMERVSSPGQTPGSISGPASPSSYIFPSGVGMEQLPTASGVSGNQSGVNWVGNMSGLNMPGLNMSGLNMSGAGLMGRTQSGAGLQPRQFWMVADAELIIYGATEPDANLSIAGQPVQLNSDGTFRLHMSFQDGNLDFPVLAVAADGQQTRAIHLTFERQTPDRRTNTRDEAIPEWPQA